MMMMTMILKAHTLNGGTLPQGLETSIRETPSPSSQILATFRFKDENNYEYEILSRLSNALA